MPRFWYMLPDFTPRHIPQAFVPRVIHKTPRVYANMEPAILIDANFDFLDRAGRLDLCRYSGFFLNSS